MQQPILFMKPSTAMIGPEDAIVYPRPEYQTERPPT